jgi:hypothetical protein
MQLQQKLSAHKLYNIQKIKYIKLMFIKLSIQQKHWGGGEMENSFFPTHIQLTQKQCRMGGGRRREGEGKEGLPLIHSCSKKLSAHKLYNIQKIKYRKLMYIKLSTEKCKGLVYIKSMTLYLMYKTGTLVILCTRVKKDFSLPPPPPSLHSFAVWEKGFCCSCMDGEVREQGSAKDWSTLKSLILYSMY